MTISPRERWALITVSSDDSYRTLIYRHRGGAWREVAAPDLGQYGHVLGSPTVDDRRKVWLTTNSDWVFRQVGQRWVKSELPDPDPEAGVVELADISVIGGVAHLSGLVVHDDGFEFDAVVYRAVGGRLSALTAVGSWSSVPDEPPRVWRRPNLLWIVLAVSRDECSYCVRA